MTPQQRHYARLGRPDRLGLPPPEPVTTSLRGLIITAAVTLAIGVATCNVFTYIVTPPQLTEATK